MGKIRGEIGGEITGTVGDVTITTWKGVKVAKRRRGSSTKPPSEAMLEARERFSIASDYGREVGANPQLKKVYASRAQGQPTTWRALATQDYLTPPLVVDVQCDDYTGKPNQPIDIRLHDVTVKEVEVQLLTPEGGDKDPDTLGVLLEEGQARRKFPDADSAWVYTTQKKLPGKHFKLVITAEDMPGNRVTHTLEGEI